MVDRKWMFVAAVVGLALCGCSSHSQTPEILPPPRPPVTDIPAVQATPAYWLDQPGTASADIRGQGDADFNRLWQACQATARDFLFAIDRTDYRSGLITTQPMVSKQWFEPWRRDAGTGRDVLRDSLQTIRRTIQFQVTKTVDGYAVVPRVLVEQFAADEPRITSVSQYANIYRPPAANTYLPTITGETPIAPPGKYHWFAIGRDPAMETSLANEIRKKIQPD